MGIGRGFPLYKKICPFCKGDSYSASQRRWICPHCNSDLSIILPEPTGWVKEERNKNQKNRQATVKVVSIYDRLSRKA